jgi:pimeloyl-ACP methyl ester carboxylesterase
MPQIAVQTDAPAPPVTIIAVHGNGGGAFRFGLVAERVPRDIRFVAPDLPGFGAATGGRTTPLASIRAYAEWLADLVDVSPGPRVLLGHGVGCAIIVELLQRHRELADGVILHAPVSNLLGEHTFPSLMRPRSLRWVAKQALASPVLRGVWRRRYFRADVPDRVVSTFFSNYARCAAYSDMFDLVTPRWFDSLQPVDVPGVLLWGEREVTRSSARQSPYTTVLPQADVVIEPGWGHFAMLDSPGAYASRISALAHTVA